MNKVIIFVCFYTQKVFLLLDNLMVELSLGLF